MKNYIKVLFLLMFMMSACEKEGVLNVDFKPLAEENTPEERLNNPWATIQFYCPFSYTDANFFPYGNLTSLHEKLNDYFSNRHFDNCTSLPPNEHYLCETTSYYGQTFSESQVNYNIFTDVVTASNLIGIKNYILNEANINKPSSAHEIVNIEVNWNMTFCCNPTQCSSTCYARFLEYTVTYAKLCPCDNLC